MPKSQEVLEAALELPEKEREMLVDKLSASLHGGFASTEIEQAWAAEIERRSAEIEAGRAVLRNWDEVRDEILADLRDRP
jgi:putative addiction module component (TIGR02574 family)